MWRSMAFVVASGGRAAPPGVEHNPSQDRLRVQHFPLVDRQVRAIAYHKGRTEGEHWDRVYGAKL